MQTGLVGQSSRAGTGRVPLADRALREIRRAILEGELLPGAALVEADLVQRLDMSKTPIREALRLLAHSGLVTSDAFRTWRVSRLSDDEIRDIYEVRAILESQAVRSASAVADESRAKELTSLIERAEVLLAEGSLHGLAAINRTLHRKLVADCGNQEVIRILTTYEERLCLAIVGGWHRINTSAEELEEHRSIVEAFIRGEADRAAELMKVHIENFAHLHGAPSALGGNSSGPAGGKTPESG
ncbi:GntR family transcriptional regulator [Rhodococcus sp. WMMA185]|uniref:GntR family transcriptional regulator n=1 Tax=Rhodococcus sp. WMMA185 TaxID=679318 RepID=UPI0018DCDAD6|nr:GntR family transcriptional regulator [Rhodococcus sp. WMMA185]